jgi:23S rRNA (cytidine2498-2'-O)-methyltransferase
VTGFRFAVCRPGFEGWLKDEWAREAADLRPSFQRPGLVTFKVTGEQARVPSVFARVQGESLGFAKTEAEILALVRAARPRVLHVFARSTEELGSRGEALGKTIGEAPQIAALRSRLRAQLPDLRDESEVPSKGDRVADVVVAEGEPTFVGLHVHGSEDAPHAGGQPFIPLPQEAPSRAYLKLEEALAFAGAYIGEGDVVIEAGSAPGGASLAMLRRGATVIGIDPGDMSPVVTAFDRFTHLQKPIGAVTRDALPARATVLVCDVHLAPPVALRAIRRIVSYQKKSLRLLVLTLKLNDARMAAEVPKFLEQVRALGPNTVRATQLPANRQEVTVVARWDLLASARSRL